MSLVVVLTDGVWTSDEIELDDATEPSLLAFADVTERSVESILEQAITAEIARHPGGRIMPSYLDTDVSDEYLQGLIAAYREGYTKAGGTTVVDDSAADILDELEAHAIRTELGARELGQAKAQAEQETQEGA